MSLTFSTFNPSAIPWQKRVINEIYSFDYSKGLHEVLLSGSVGSAKTTLLAHLVVRHCLENPNAKVLICRRTLPDLKTTLYEKIIEHLSQEDLQNKFIYRDTNASIDFVNGSKIRAGYWADKRYKKFRSQELSMLVVEELTENNEEESQAYYELIQRVRLGKKLLAVCATNPDAPSHWAHKHFILNKDENRHVYYSLTSDNPFLPAGYVDGLRRNLDHKMAMRMLEGKWIELTKDVIYYAYNRNISFLNEEIKVNPAYPVDMSFDFNIGLNKPMSCLIGQHINGKFICIDEIVIHGSRTLDVLEEFHARGYTKNKVRVYGDATGAARSTNSLHSNYELITNFLSNVIMRSNYEMHVPRSNPPVRERHNIVNGKLMNSVGSSSVIISSKCVTLDEGLRLTALRKGADYVEDDSKSFQHLTTAFGYWISYIEKLVNIKGYGEMKR